MTDSLFKKSILIVLILISFIFFLQNTFYVILNDKLCILENEALIEHKVTRESILQGQYPGWDPYHLRPILSNSQSQIFYPPALFFNLLLGPELMLKVMLYISIVISFLAFYKLSILIGFDKEISIFLSSLYVTFSNIPTHVISCKLEYIFSYPLIPLVFLFYIYWIQSKERKYFFFSIIFLSFINLTGDVPSFAISIVLMLLYSKILKEKFSFYIPLFALLLSSIKLFPYFISHFNISAIKIFLPDNLFVFIPFLFIITVLLFKSNSKRKYQKYKKNILIFLVLCTLIINYPFNFKILQSTHTKIFPRYKLTTSTIANFSFVNITPNRIDGYFYLNQSKTNIEPIDLFSIKQYYYPFSGWYGYVNDKLVISHAFLELIQSPMNLSAGSYKFTLEYNPLSTKFGFEITIFFLIYFILYFFKPHIFFNHLEKIFLLIILILQIQLFMRMFLEESIHELAPEEIVLFKLVREGYTFPNAYTPHAGYVIPTITSFVWHLSTWITKSYTFIYTAVISYFFYLFGSLLIFLLGKDFLSKKTAILALMLYVSDLILIRTTRILMDCHILPFFILTTLYFLLKYVNSKGMRRFFYLLLFAVISGLGAMVQFSYLMFLIPCFFFFLFFYRKKIKFKEIFLYFLIFLLIVSPHIKLYYTTPGSKNVIQSGINMVKDMINRYLQILFLREARGFNILNPTHISTFYLIADKKTTFFIYIIFMLTSFVLGLFKKIIKKEDLFILLTSLTCLIIFPSYETIGILLVPLWILLVTRSLDIIFILINERFKLLCCFD